MRRFSPFQIAVNVFGCILTSLTFASPCSAQARAIPQFAPQINSDWPMWSAIVKSAALSPNGKIAVTMSEGGVFTLWDAKTGQTLREFKAHSRSSIFNSPAVFSPDSSKLLTVGSRSSGNVREAKLWSVETGELLWTIAPQKGNDNYYISLFNPVFSPDGKWLATTGTPSQPVYLWNAQTGQLVRELPTPRILVRHLAFSPHSTTLAGGGIRFDALENRARSGEIVLWNIDTGAVLSEFHHPQNTMNTEIHSIAFSPDGKTLATGGIIFQRTKNVAAISATKQGPDARQGEVGLWDIQRGVRISALTVSSKNVPVTQLAFSPDGQYLATGSRDDIVRLFDLVNGRLIGSTTQYGALENSQTTEVKKGKPGVFQQETVTYGDLGSISKSRSETPGPLPTGEGELRVVTIKNVAHGKGIAAIRFSSDGKTLDILALDRQVRSWSIADLQIL
ncbi:MAG TPA: WD40 repeat domain-containing protein [Abditibacteriaceae bacterium]|jgi:WD40 repeat protein